MRLSLIKSATMPDTTADQGLHRFTYALLPHQGNTRTDVRQEAYALNCPPRVFSGPGNGRGVPAAIIRCYDPRAVIETVKPAEDGHGIIVRVFESHNTRGWVMLALHPAVKRVENCGLLERDTDPLDIIDHRVAVYVTNYQILTLRLRLD